MATPRQWRRRRRVSLFALTVVGALIVAAVALGAVTTDNQDYTPGSVVTISGDNSDGAGYVPGNPVDVAVSGGNGWSDSCSATVASAGTWSCTVTLSSDPAVAVGSYTYTATSTAENGSTISESGTFTDASIITGSTTATVGVNGTYTSATTSGNCNLTSFTWSVAKKPGSATGAGSVASGQGSSSVQISFTEAGQVRISLAASGTKTPPASGSCDATDQIDVDVAASTNHAPVADAGLDVSGNEGSPISLDGSNSYDPDSDALTYSWVISNPTLCSFDDSTSATPKVTCTDNGTFTATLTVTDTHNVSNSDDATVTVYNVNPVIESFNCPTDPVKVGTSVSLGGSFSDAGKNDTHTALYAWDDNTTSAGTVTETQGTGTGTVTGSHTYTSAGIYTPSLTVTDDDLGSSGPSTCQYVVVYDPSAGFVTGGGWIMSPAGAYAADPDLLGKATFGFVSKYKKGANVPDGNTEFQFHAASLNFSSTSYQWLVVGGAKATYKGSGTINGTGDYGFLLSAIDGQLNGGGGTDKFRIKIWDASTSEVVYDNLVGAADDADPTTVLGGGSIVIHTK